VSVSRRPNVRSRLLTAGLVAFAAALPLSGCTEVETETATGYEPSKLEPVKGKGPDAVRVTFTREGAKRVRLETATVREAGNRKVVPYAALIYDAEGKTYVYTSPEPLSYLREPVEVDRIDGSRVLLSDGPPAGAEVVTVGAAEVYGTELEVPSH
jgi:multidrug efflux pump subunit AcrA (membrane-fusion protein)